MTFRERLRLVETPFTVAISFTAFAFFLSAKNADWEIVFAAGSTAGSLLIVTIVRFIGERSQKT